MPEEKKKAGQPNVSITVYGKEYRCYPTMGAALGFKQQTGRDIEDMKGTSDFAVYIYCCARSAYRREHKEDLPLSLEEFCDGVLIDDLNRINGEMQQGAADNSGRAKKN